MYVYNTTNPCLCTRTPSDPPCPKDCNCLELCDITVNSYDKKAVGPCGKDGFLDLLDPSYSHDFCACGDNERYWSIEYFDKDIFVTASVNSETGVLSYVTQGVEALNKIYGKVILKFCCGRLSQYLTVIIGIKDLCDCPSCSDCEICDPCTGDCLDSDIDLVVGGSSNGSDTMVKGK